jgi:hypothetical protein
LCLSGELMAGIGRLRECLELFPSEDANADIARRLLATYESGDDEDDK